MLEDAAVDTEVGGRFGEPAALLVNKEGKGDKA
jgi:hypothetical protein